jgi:hypothetical protein
MAGVSEWKPGTLVLYHDGELLCRHYSVLEVRPAAVPEGTSKRRNRLEPATLLPEPAGKRRKAQDPSPKCEKGPSLQDMGLQELQEQCRQRGVTSRTGRAFLKLRRCIEDFDEGGRPVRGARKRLCRGK